MHINKNLQLKNNLSICLCKNWANELHYRATFNIDCARCPAVQ